MDIDDEIWWEPLSKRLRTADEVVDELLDMESPEEAVERIANRTSREIMWFGRSTTFTDRRRRLPVDLQCRILFHTDAKDLRSMAQCCRDWNECVPAILRMQRNILLPCAETPLTDNGNLRLVHVSGMIVPPVPNKMWAENDQRYPVVVSTRAQLHYRVFSNVTYRWRQYGKFDIIPVDIGHFLQKAEMWIHEDSFRFQSGYFYKVKLPMKTLSRGAISNLYKKIQGQVTSPASICGFCPYCGRKRKHDRPCKVCGTPAATVQDAYTRWVHFR